MGLATSQGSLVSMRTDPSRACHGILFSGATQAHSSKFLFLQARREYTKSCVLVLVILSSKPFGPTTPVAFA